MNETCCSYCGKPINEGDDLTYSTSIQGIVHKECKETYEAKGSDKPEVEGPEEVSERKMCITRSWILFCLQKYGNHLEDCEGDENCTCGWCDVKSKITT